MTVTLAKPARYYYTVSNESLAVLILIRDKESLLQQMVQNIQVNSKMGNDMVMEYSVSQMEAHMKVNG